MGEPSRAIARELTANPLAWASYAAWGAVWLAVSGVYGRPAAEFPSTPDAILFAWLLCWLICLLDDLLPARVIDAALVGLTGLTGLALWLLPAGATPIPRSGTLAAVAGTPRCGGTQADRAQAQSARTGAAAG
ncbi:MAG: hypothetical protein LC637_12670 [Xanthomonadaceae bacterium]|nr:hypothetical protein [Xanthomonadaceae bacterium]